MNALDRAAETLGGLIGIARLLTVSPSAVSNWRSNGSPGVPIDRCAQIERATEGAVACEEMRPDVTWVRIPDPDWPHPQGRPLLDVSRRREKVAA